jgi:hypothetical protein
MGFSKGTIIPGCNYSIGSGVSTPLAKSLRMVQNLCGQRLQIGKRRRRLGGSNSLHDRWFFLACQIRPNRTPVIYPFSAGERALSQCQSLACFMLNSMAIYQDNAVMAQSPPNLDLQPAALPHAKPPVQRKSLRLIFGIVLMASSFLVYPAYPVILLWLPLSAGAKATASIAIWVLSWSAFSLGGYLAGPQGYACFKGLWHRLTGRRMVG